jgi:cytochrome c peroxidase
LRASFKNRQPDDGRRSRKRSRRHRAALFGAGAVLTAVIVLRLVLPDPPPRLRTNEMSEDGVRALVGSLARPLREPSRSSQAVVDFGVKLLRDSKLAGADGQPCASCHDPLRAWTKATPVADSSRPRSRNVPSLSQLPTQGPYGWDGRDVNLIPFLTAHLEDAAAGALARTSLAKIVRSRYANEWKSAFGTALPGTDVLEGDAPEAAPPPNVFTFVRQPSAPKHPALPLPTTELVKAPQDNSTVIALAAGALGTLGDSDLITDVLQTAQAERHAPAMELLLRATKTTPAPTAWSDEWAKLPQSTRDRLDTVASGVGTALAAALRQLVIRDAPFDRFARRVAAGATVSAALDTRFGELELAGLKVFAGPGGCQACHAGGDFSDGEFHNVGLPQLGTEIDLGRALALVTVNPRVAPETAVAALGAYRTPGLRNVALTAPYMHDGRFETLRDVLGHYNAPQPRPALGTRDARLSLSPKFSREEIDALVAFLESLTSATPSGSLEAASRQPASPEGGAKQR